ncbi:MAG: bifunctional 5,10-methylene-tetrahydrofolate dehydrogenase/5,10-methylene-tetrahydrofolate cyclohydrolase [Candidatus Omnitrophica bacterium CG11_big_fil_rev_8_21_14_0_20_64_10]|nr:MAG: bifunctional 5,10-methylene-tetrahydrofolate dehydrogenase/5,10-methylene-tetrahydrofolate cyclohydrolase [Candidatus Omnitrophica bacterium CG11_big_fil_rev_8_21_14_0_20_64_10]
MAQILDGSAIAGKLYEKLKGEVAQLTRKHGEAPFLLSVQVGTHSASDLFARSQARAAERLGIGYRLERLSPETTPEGLLKRIEHWNRDPEVTGVTIQFPLPAGFDARAISAALDPRKDVEGIHPQHIGQSMFGWSRIGTCTSLAVMELIDSTGADLYGKEAVIVGHSELIGKPVSLMLLDRLCTTTVCHVATADRGRLAEHVRRAEVLVVAVGKASLVKGEWVRPESIVIDVGINLVNGRVVGDVEFEPAARKASFITPVPGGVGPVVVATLMRNTVEAFKLQAAGR